jgi:hypothetical protein
MVYRRGSLNYVITSRLKLTRKNIGCMLPGKSAAHNRFATETRDTEKASSGIYCRSHIDNLPEPFDTLVSG